MERTGWECRLDRDLRSRGRGGGLVDMFFGDLFWGCGEMV